MCLLKLKICMRWARVNFDEAGNSNNLTSSGSSQRLQQQVELVGTIEQCIKRISRQYAEIDSRHERLSQHARFLKLESKQPPLDLLNKSELLPGDIKIYLDWLVPFTETSRDHSFFKATLEWLPCTDAMAILSRALDLRKFMSSANRPALPPITQPPASFVVETCMCMGVDAPLSPASESDLNISIVGIRVARSAHLRSVSQTPLAVADGQRLFHNVMRAFLPLFHNQNNHCRIMRGFGQSMNSGTKQSRGASKFDVRDATWLDHLQNFEPLQKEHDIVHKERLLAAVGEGGGMDHFLVLEDSFVDETNINSVLLRAKEVPPYQRTGEKVTTLPSHKLQLLFLLRLLRLRTIKEKVFSILNALRSLEKRVVTDSQVHVKLILLIISHLLTSSFSRDMRTKTISSLPPCRVITCTRMQFLRFRSRCSQREKIC